MPGPDFQGDEHQFPLSRVLRTSTFWLILAALFLSSTTTAGIGLHLVPHLTHQGLTPAAAVGAVSVMSISGAVSALVSGVVAERVSAKLMMVSLNLLGAVSMWVLTLADTLPEAYLFAVIQGLVGSGVNTLAPIMWANYYGRKTLGSIFGISRSAQVVGFAVGPLASAAVFDETGTYRAAFLSLIIVALAAFAPHGHRQAPHKTIHNAWARSSIRSSTFSSPTDTRSRLSGVSLFGPSMEARCSIRL